MVSNLPLQRGESGGEKPPNIAGRKVEIAVPRGSEMLEGSGLRWHEDWGSYVTILSKRETEGDKGCGVCIAGNVVLIDELGPDDVTISGQRHKILHRERVAIARHPSGVVPATPQGDCLRRHESTKQR